jgi:hypothetical protein
MVAALCCIAAFSCKSTSTAPSASGTDPALTLYFPFRSGANGTVEDISGRLWGDSYQAGVWDMKGEIRALRIFNRAVLAIANTLPKEMPVTVAVDLTALGLPPGAMQRLTDERTGASIPWNNGQFTVPVKAQNYTLVSVQPQTAKN